MFGGIKAKCESISTLNFDLSGFHLLLPPCLFLGSLCLFAFHGCCLCRSDDWWCLSEAAPTVLSPITKAQSVSISCSFLKDPLQ